MAENYTLLFLSQQFPDFEHFSVFSYDEILPDANVADFLQKAERQVSRQTLENVYSFAEASLQSRK